LPNPLVRPIEPCTGDGSGTSALRLALVISLNERETMYRILLSRTLFKLDGPVGLIWRAK
jgi:hypothetical protein